MQGGAQACMYVVKRAVNKPLHLISRHEKYGLLELVARIGIPRTLI